MRTMINILLTGAIASLVVLGCKEKKDMVIQKPVSGASHYPPLPPGFEPEPKVVDSVSQPVVLVDLSNLDRYIILTEDDRIPPNHLVIESNLGLYYMTITTNKLAPKGAGFLISSNEFNWMKTL